MPALVHAASTMPLPMSTPKLAQDLLLALIVAIAALLLQWALAPWIGRHLPFMVIEPAIIFTAAALGRLPATLVMLIGAANAAVAFSPTGQWLVTDRAGRLAIVAYAIISALVIAYGGRLHLRGSRAHRAEQRLNLAQDETGVGLFELDFRADTAYASPALCQILGQPVMKGPMPLQQWLNALNAGLVADSRRTLQEKVAVGELRYERELRLELPDGQPHWLLSRIRLDLDDDGKLAAARGATLDITARKQLVTELEAAQSQLRQQLDDLNRLHSLGNRLLAMPVLDAALQAILDGVCSFHDTAFGVLRLCEAAGGSRVAAHCGLTSEALAQLASNELAFDSGSVGGASRSRRHVLVEDIEHGGALDALRPLAVALGARAVHSTPLIAGCNGRVLGELIVLTTTAGPPGESLLRLTDLCAGQAAALIERDQALSLARETQQRFEVALQSSSVAFTILTPVRDAAGRIIDFAWSYANPAAAALIDRPVQDLVGHRILDVLPHAWDDPGFFERYVQVSEQDSTAEFDTLTRRAGGERWLHVIASPLNGSVVLWFADITQHRKEQQALHDADRRKDEFLATLAHELRNPLAPIRHAAAIVRDPAASEPQRHWSLTVIERQLQHMALLLDDLLDVSRITRGTLTLRRERCELQAIVEAAAEASRPLFSERQHRLDLDLPDDPVWLDVDPLRIAQVLGNLLVNAARYTPPGGHVVLAARREGAEIVIAVTDNGNGLQPADCERVFEMFMQVPLPDGRSQGLGIGLALARNLMKMHGGQLDAHSDGPGRGCTFTVRIPGATAVGPSASFDAASEETITPIAAPPRRRILIADDNRDAADSMALLLEFDGHEVQVAYDGRDALDRYRSFRPQVALLDMAMPQHTGAEVAALIRRQEGGGSITLVAVTGFGQERDRLQALEAGFDHHLTKPIQLHRLKSLLDGVSDARR